MIMIMIMLTTTKSITTTTIIKLMGLIYIYSHERLFKKNIITYVCMHVFCHIYIKIFVYKCGKRLDSLQHMFTIGLNFNDLSMHDFSRELILAMPQNSAELRLTQDQVLGRMYISYILY